MKSSRMTTYILVAMVLFSFSDATAKFLTQSLPALEIAWLRFACFVTILLPALVKTGRQGIRSRRPALQLVRGLSLVASSVLFVLAVRYLPMADATATSFVSPLFTTALAIPFLGERVGIRRWSAVASTLAISVLPTPASPSRKSGRFKCNAKCTAVARLRSAM